MGELQGGKSQFELGRLGTAGTRICQGVGWKSSLCGGSTGRGNRPFVKGHKPLGGVRENLIP